ncbi:MAG TPA: CBS domain-containing protein [Thauera aminoaromatica]|uniref:CBS domain-containing protein n=1 Tax=Thauera aminoaromatica TaxID=164330 RepID=A0A5C7SKH7_THASP|nr:MULTISPECIES: CBS domain-containing protein [Thauera]MDA0234675.1 CBS domain-containing protein [Pseudomonadota bacterium]MBP6131215.1 CBS domain-containing protein [Thauera sp.]MBP7046741.1 CBS domain-containing protein [Thauera sp.]TXH84150.1 MAG: CBS domain-containing protein [Thauera aminoaromatica]HMU16270.1 CBS domain-containing protein [Thauera aminoaromatica]
MLVSEILAIKGKVLFTIGPNRPIAEAVEIMNEQDVGSLVVFSRGEMVGMLTFRQVLQAVQQGGADWQSLQVEAVMLREPRVASPDMEMDELRRLMVEHHQRYLPVMDGNTLLGVVSFHDVAKAVLEEQSFENRMLKNYIRNWPAGEGEE